MLQLIIFMLGGYFVIKGYEIFQVALLSNREGKLRFFAIIGSVVAWMLLAVIGIGGIYVSIDQGKEMSMPPAPYMR
jgi:uncharacterized membrane protein